MGTPHLSVSDLAKDFGPVVALRGLSLDVERGEFLTVLGPSGSGKSTFLNLVAGFEPPGSGTIRLAGRDITRDPAYKRDLGMVFQNYALFPHLSVAENVAFPLRMRRSISESNLMARVRDALALVQLDSFQERFPHELSGGQSQRVAIARAVVHRPALLLMDEPLGALDRKLRVEMQFEIKRLHRELGATVVYVTHDQEEALTMSDRIAVLRGGELEQCASPNALYGQPRTQFVAGFVGESNFFQGEVIAADGRIMAAASGLDITFPVPSDRDWRIGQPVVISFRPEHVKLASDVGDDPSRRRLKAVVHEFNFLGDAIKYKLIVNGSPILAKFPADTIGAEMRVGQAMEIVIDAAKCTLFTPSPQAASRAG
jgi:putative spermidine/putrescine transport system ATP-binding protein